MSNTKLIAIFILMALGASLSKGSVRAVDSAIVISEVMSNPESETTDEFIELYNYSDLAMDLAGWHFTDGDAVDEIIAWDSLSRGDIPGTILNTTIIPAESYAVILDPDYNSGRLPYHFPENTLILTVANSSLGNGLTPATDPLLLYRAGGTTLEYLADTYGTPVLNDNPLLCDDDTLDNIPFDPGEGISVEKIDFLTGDLSDNWSSNADKASTPGTDNNPRINQPPQIISTAITPSPVPLDGATTALIKAKVSDPDGANDISRVNIDLSPLDGLINQPLYDDGSHGDVQDGDEWYSFGVLLSDDLDPGTYELTVTVADWQGQITTANMSLALEAVEYSDQVMINELLPNPSGTDTTREFIELVNSGKADVNLTGWQLTDGSNTYSFPAETQLKKQRYLAFFSAQTKISLNNGGDTVSLLTPRGDLVSKITYDAAPGEDISYMRGANNHFFWTTTPTPNAANILTEIEEETGEKSEAQKTPSAGAEKASSVKSTTTASAAKKSAAPKTVATFQTMTISDARKADKNTKVKIIGLVTARPKMLSDKFFYIQDGDSGIQVYSSKSDFPELKLGQEIEVSGTTSEAQGEKKINIAAEAIKILEQKEVPAAQETLTGQVGEEQEGKLIVLKAAISRQSGKTFYLDDASGEAKISITGNFEKPEMKKGESVEITGIVGQTSAGYRVMPRQAEDIKKSEPAGTETATDDATIKKLPAAGPSSHFFVIIALAVAGAGVLVRIIWTKRNKKTDPADRNRPGKIKGNRERINSA